MTVFSFDLDTIEAEDIYHVSGGMLTLTGGILWPIAGISYFVEPAVSGDFFFIGTMMMIFGLFLLIGGVLMRQA
jgi:hypothetical protein